jgi:hypothetical protein
MARPSPQQAQLLEPESSVTLRKNCSITSEMKQTGKSFETLQNNERCCVSRDSQNKNSGETLEGTSVFV